MLRKLDLSAAGGRTADPTTPHAAGPMKSDPEGAVSGAGIQLSKEEKAALANVDWSLSDQELQVRASKANPL